MAKSVKVEPLSGFAAVRQTNDRPLVSGRITALELDITIKRFAADLRGSGYSEAGIRRRIHVITERSLG